MQKLSTVLAAPQTRWRRLPRCRHASAWTSGISATLSQRRTEWDLWDAPLCAQSARKGACRVGPLGCTTSSQPTKNTATTQPKPKVASLTEWDHWDAPLEPFRIGALKRRAEWDRWDAPLSALKGAPSGTSGMHHCALNRPEKGVPCGTTGMHHFQSTYQKHSDDPERHMADASDEYQQQQREKQNTGEKEIGIRWRQQCSSLSGTFMLCTGGGCRFHDFLALLSLGQGLGEKGEQ